MATVLYQTHFTVSITCSADEPGYVAIVTSIYCQINTINFIVTVHKRAWSVGGGAGEGREGTGWGGGGEMGWDVSQW